MAYRRTEVQLGIWSALLRSPVYSRTILLSSLSQAPFRLGHSGMVVFSILSGSVDLHRAHGWRGAILAAFHR